MRTIEQVRRPSEIILKHTKTNKKAILQNLLINNLDFHDEDSGYISHSLHPFPAKFPPQIPGFFIDNLTQPGDTVLDPMLGSGTTILEALLKGRKAIGYDIDLLALQICQAKITKVNPETIEKMGKSILFTAQEMLKEPEHLSRKLQEYFDEKTKAFVNYWFREETQLELMALIQAISKIVSPEMNRLFRLIFSSIIITKTGGVSMAMDLAHSRPHKVESKKQRIAIEQFNKALSKTVKSFKVFPERRETVIIDRADARNLPTESESVDLIVTSPPYASNAIDYMRAHKFSLVWFGHSITELGTLRKRYIGAEHQIDIDSNLLPDLPIKILRRLSALDLRKAKVLNKYFLDMKIVLDEMYRVLKKDGSAIVVVGSSMMRGLDVLTHECLGSIGEMVGFDLVNIRERNLDRDRRMMPARFGKKVTGIEERMHKEYVIGLFKSD